MRHDALPRKIAWGLYDLANTIFSMNVISLYLPLWVASEFQRGDVLYPVAYSASMIVVALLSPFVGAAGERIGQKKLLLIATIAAVVGTATIGRGSSLATVLLLFATANIGYQLGLVAYNALLPSVAAPLERGKTSGLGVALGYIGSLTGMLFALPFTAAEHYAKAPRWLQHVVDTLTITPLSGTSVQRENVFIPTAILFALFAIPLFLLVREVRSPRSSATTAIRQEVAATFRQILRDRNLLRFFLATFFYMDAVHTTYIVMATYGKFVANLTDGEIVKVMTVAILTAVAGSFVYGWLTDRVSRRASMLVVVVNWLVALTLAAFVYDFRSFLVVAVIAGIGLGGVEVVGRVALLALVPDEESGRFFGFFNLTGKASSIVGPQLWALALFLFEPLGTGRYRVGIVTLLSMTVIAFFLVRSLEFARREPAATAETR